MLSSLFLRHGESTQCKQLGGLHPRKLPPQRCKEPGNTGQYAPQIVSPCLPSPPALLILQGGRWPESSLRSWAAWDNSDHQANSKVILEAVRLSRRELGQGMSSLPLACRSCTNKVLQKVQRRFLLALRHVFPGKYKCEISLILVQGN